MSRGIAYNRHHRNRIIRKKLFILKEILLLDLDDTFVKGSLFKGKVHCSCRMCKYEKFYGIEKYKYEH